MKSKKRDELETSGKILNLRARLFLLIAALVITNLLGASLTLWYTHRSQNLHETIIDRDLTTLMAAQKLESALVMQKGYVTYYFLTEDPQWLERLREHHAAFEKGLMAARESTYRPDSLKMLNEIDSLYVRYAFERDNVINLYKQGLRDKGAELHWKVRNQFHAIYDLCERYKLLHEEYILDARKEYEKEARFLATFAWSAIPGSVVLAFLLGGVLTRQVLEPIRRLARQAVGETEVSQMDNEVKALGNSVKVLMDNVDQARYKLKQSREHLMQWEKLALVGKLAAGVAHSIRNPLTSIKMRLFSLERSLQLDSIQKDDFEVISEELSHLDTIVGNFLEFSRPPRLRTQFVSLSDVVDMTLQLMRHRLDSYNVDVSVKRAGRLPKTMADPEQLKEMLVNLMLNACEAMGDGGTIEIREAMYQTEANANYVVMEVQDSGPGIPDNVRDKVFEPFYSGKEEGAGLGLSIARRIVEEHDGTLELGPVGEPGATFVITLPVREDAK